MMGSDKTMRFKKIQILIGIVALLVVYITFCLISDGINVDYFETSAQKHKIIHCPEELSDKEINANDFFIFNSNIVWCNVFKSASTR